MKRDKILRTAESLTTGPRADSYGEPYDNMLNFACLLAGYFNARWSLSYDSVTAEDAAFIMVLAKMARTINHELPPHDDNYIDLAAYAAMAGEIARQEREQ